MIKFKFIAILLFTCNIFAFGQTKFDSRIYLRAKPSSIYGEGLMEIISGQDSTKITFQLEDSVSINLEIDSNYINCRNFLFSIHNLSTENDTVLIYLKKLDSICRAYTYYSEDSIKIANHENMDYLQLINMVLNSSTETLENKIYHKNRISLDGTSMTFLLTFKGLSRTVYAHSPNLKSNSLLYKLIRETKQLYRKIKKNDFLDNRQDFKY